MAEQEEQQRMDLMMEIERLRALEAYQVRQADGVPMWASTACRQQLAAHHLWSHVDA